jgi:hypothetical protein
VPRLAVLHAARVALVWAAAKRVHAVAAVQAAGQAQGKGMSKGKAAVKRDTGVLGDLFGYLTMACESDTLPALRATRHAHS